MFLTYTRTNTQQTHTHAHTHTHTHTQMSFMNVGPLNESARNARSTRRSRFGSMMRARVCARALAPKTRCDDAQWGVAQGRLCVCILFHLFSSIVRPAAAAGRIFQQSCWHVFFFGRRFIVNTVLIFLTFSTCESRTQKSTCDGVGRCCRRSGKSRPAAAAGRKKWKLTFLPGLVVTLWRAAARG